METIYLEFLEQLELAVETTIVKNKSTLDSCREIYRAKMREVVESSKELLKQTTLSDEHLKWKRDAIDEFRNKLILSENDKALPHVQNLDQVRTIHIFNFKTFVILENHTN